MPLHTGAGGGPPHSLAQYELRCSLVAQLPIGRVFRFFEEPRNLAKITPNWLRFEIRTSGGIEMREGLELQYTIRWIGLPMSWKSLITRYDPPRLFVDEQIQGPYRYWHHEHTFVSEGNATRISDRVRYALPFGPFGRIAQAVLVKRQLLGIFKYRQKAVEKLLGVECRELEAPAIRRLAL